MPPMPIFRYARDAASPTTAKPAPATVTTTGQGDHPPNAGLIAGLVTCFVVVLFLIIVVVIPMLKRRRQRSAPPVTTVEDFLGKDSNFDKQKPGDIAAILDHLSYLPQTQNAPHKPGTPKRRSLVLLGRRLSNQVSGQPQRPPSVVTNQRGRTQRQSGYQRESGYQQWDSYYEQDYHEHDQHSREPPPPLDEYANSPGQDPFMVPASAPAAVSTSHNFATRPLNIRARSNFMPSNQQRQPRRHDGYGSDSDYSQSDEEDEYTHAHDSAQTYRYQTQSGKENRKSSVGDRLKSRFSREYYYGGNRESFSLADAPRTRKNRAPPLSKSSNGARNSPRPQGNAAPLDPLPEIPNSSIAVGFSLPDSPGDVVVVTPTSTTDNYHHVPLTPRNVELPRTPGSPLREMYGLNTPLREIQTPRTPRTPRTPLREVLTPRTPLPYTPRTPA